MSGWWVHSASARRKHRWMESEPWQVPSRSLGLGASCGLSSGTWGHAHDPTVWICPEWPTHGWKTTTNAQTLLPELLQKHRAKPKLTKAAPWGYRALPAGTPWWFPLPHSWPHTCMWHCPPARRCWSAGTSRWTGSAAGGLPAGTQTQHGVRAPLLPPPEHTTAFHCTAINARRALINQGLNSLLPLYPRREEDKELLKFSIAYWFFTETPTEACASRRQLLQSQRAFMEFL